MPTATLSKKALKLISNSVDENDILEHYINLLWYHKQELNFIEDKIRKISEENPEAKLLITIPGIAEIRGMDIIAAIGDINLLLVILIFAIAAILGDSLNYYLEKSK